MYQLPGITNKPATVFSDGIENSALQQFREAIEQEWVARGALMPDAHCGYSLPIGGVVATKGVIVPAYVGYDIGCGVGAIKTRFTVNDVKQNRLDIYKAIVDNVPLGVGVYRRKSVMNYRQIHDSFQIECSDFLMKEIDQNALTQLGSLGSGNHFIEIGYDSTNSVWIIVHSGSRGVGHACATHYMQIAQPAKGSKEGHYPLDVNSIEGKNYIKDLAFMLEFALTNRAILLNDVLNCINTVFGNKEIPFIYRKGNDLSDTHKDVTFFVNRNHNHAEFKALTTKSPEDGSYRNEEVWIHRKGATHADAQMYGVIPGNMRDGSFIVRGKGNLASLCSSSHGAGRVLGRKEAKRTLNVDEFIDTMKDITCGVDNNPAGLLDEAPAAYKNIFTVMEEQQDLVEVVTHISPLINVKR